MEPKPKRAIISFSITKEIFLFEYNNCSII